MPHIVALGMPGGPELIFILVVLLLFFGAKRLPELSRSLGKSLSEFKRGKREGETSELEEHQDKEKLDATAKDKDVD